MLPTVVSSVVWYGCWYCYQTQKMCLTIAACCSWCWKIEIVSTNHKMHHACARIDACLPFQSPLRASRTRVTISKFAVNIWKTTWAIFWKKINKYGNSTKKLPQQQRGALRALLVLAVFVLVPYLVAFFPKNGPGSFLQVNK